MSSAPKYSPLAILALVAACSADADDGGPPTPSTGGGMSAGATDSVGAGAGAAAGATAVGGSTGSGGAVAAGGEATGTGGATAAGGAPPASCGAPTTGGGGTPTLSCTGLGGSCGSCVGEKCCDLLLACSTDADCACMAQCVGGGGLGATSSCLGSCGVSGSPPGFAALAQCVATTCPDGDECSAPAGYAPPPDVAPTGAGSSLGIGSGTLADCSFDLGLPYVATGEVLQLQSADGSICARVERRNDGPGSLANTSFTLLDLRVGPLGEVAHISDPSAVCWYSSHHNFNDWAHASSGSRHYDLKAAMANHGMPTTYTLYVFEGGPLTPGSCGATSDGYCPIGEPIELFPVP